MQDLSVLVGYVRSLATRPDLILYAGDDLGRFHPAPDINYFAQLAACATNGLGAVAANDDRPRAAARLIVGRRVRHVHAKPLLLRDVAIAGLSGAPEMAGEIAVGTTLFSEAAIAARLRRGLRHAATRPVILLSHAPPRGVLDHAVRFGEGFIGSESIATALDAPRCPIALVVCGHVHGRGGKDVRVGGTVVANAASHDGLGSPLKVGHLTIGGAARATVSPVEWIELAPVRPDAMRRVARSTAGPCAACGARTT